MGSKMLLVNLTRGMRCLGKVVAGAAEDREIGGQPHWTHTHELPPNRPAPLRMCQRTGASLGREGALDGDVHVPQAPRLVRAWDELTLAGAAAYLSLP